MEEFYKQAQFSYDLELTMTLAIRKMLASQGKFSVQEIEALILLREDVRAQIRANEWLYDHRN